MRKYLILITLCITSQHLSLAQGGPGRGRQFDPTQMVTAEKQLLLDSITGLSDDQKLIIEVIYNDYLAAFEKAQESMDPDNRQAMRSNMEKIRDDKDAALKEVLTEEQFLSFEEMLASRREQMRQRRQNRNE